MCEMRRRDFFQTLSAGLLAMAGVNLSPKITQLPIGCDLSMGSLDWAVREGRSKGFGRPRWLRVGSNHIEVARWMLGTFGQPCDPIMHSLQDEMLRYEASEDLPKNFWRLEFDHGIIARAKGRNPHWETNRR
jgi:hypothetical protein